MDGRIEALVEREPGEASSGGSTPFDFEATFLAQFDRVVRLLGRVVRDPARAEELGVEVFLKLWRSPEAQAGNAEGWLYRTAVRKGLDELRSRTRRATYERLLSFTKHVRTPEDIRAASEEQEKVRSVLEILSRRQAELLVLRSHGLSYGELAAALAVNPASVGALLGRAQTAFRREYVKRYGEE
ncbi:MAG: sigma-70 family RNA polymerase sigma factor [Bryobacteraceae bacterium]